MHFWVVFFFFCKRLWTFVTFGHALATSHWTLKSNSNISMNYDTIQLYWISITQLHTITSAECIVYRQSMLGYDYLRHTMVFRSRGIETSKHHIQPLNTYGYNVKSVSSKHKLYHSLFYHLAHVPNQPFVHGTWNTISCRLVKCMFLFFFHGNQRSDGTYWENIAHCAYSLFLTYTNFGMFRGLTLFSPLFSSRSMAVNPMRIFFCYYNQTWSFFACSSISSYIFISFSTFFSHFSFFVSLLRSSVIRRPI